LIWREFDNEFGLNLNWIVDLKRVKEMSRKRFKIGIDIFFGNGTSIW
jgi:hypothetical protein